ncbi:MAG TPA: PAS domain-containing protein [Chthoniobacter sp.]|nr:PAS domain-containing protein [Chthoniobacter sp.]
MDSATCTTSQPEHAVISKGLEDHALLQFVLDHSSDRIFFKDKESRFIRISRSLAKRFGLQDEDAVVGKTDFDFFSPLHAQNAFNDERQIMQTGQPIFGKIERETMPDGRIRFAYTTKMPLRSDNGNIVGTCGISTDLAKQMNDEEMVAKSYTLLGGAQVEKILVYLQTAQRLVNSAHEELEQNQFRNICLSEEPQPE